MSEGRGARGGKANRHVSVVNAKAAELENGENSEENRGEGEADGVEEEEEEATNRGEAKVEDEEEKFEVETENVAEERR